MDNRYDLLTDFALDNKENLNINNFVNEIDASIGLSENIQIISNRLQVS